MKNLIRWILVTCLIPGSALARTVATFHTPAGDMDVELYDDQKPATVQNFINLVQKGAYYNSFFHRCEPSSVLQGGGYSTASQTSLSLFNQALYVPNYGKVTNEFLVGQKFSNTYGTIAMAKVDGDPNSATSQFFFNLGNNAASFDVANGGYTVFGKVINGTNVLEYFKALQSGGGGIIDMRTYVSSWYVFNALPVNYQGFGWPRFSDLMYTDIKLSNYVPYYRVITATNGSGTVAATPSQPAYPTGTVIQLSAAPAEGYAFTSWTGSYESTQNPLSIVISSNLNITAKFDRTWSLSVTSSLGGYVTKIPDQAVYANQSTVTILPTAYPGFKFSGWSGSTNGTMNPLVLVMDTNKNLGASFLDIAPPEIILQSPIAGTVESEKATLSGFVSDNVKLGTVRWELDGQSQGFLTISSSNTFSYNQVVLHRGANVIRVVASDSSGNVGDKTVIVTYEPARSIAPGAVADRQEGDRLAVPLQLTSRGDVGGINFILTYDTNYLADAICSWGSLAAGAQKQLQPLVPGRVQANFQQSTAIPSGTMTFATVSFRLRSVPNALSTPLNLTVSRVNQASGAQILYGTEVQNGSVGIVKRTIAGDGNANNKLDVGDAVLIQKLISGISPQRAWDITGNDLNKNSRLDADDVNRVLRVAAGLDAQPAGAAGFAAADDAGSSNAEAAVEAAVQASIVLPVSEQAVAAPQTGQVTEGQNIAVQIVFTNLSSQVSGSSLEFGYPTNAFRLISRQTNSPFVPSSAAAVWNEVADESSQPAGRLILAASSPTTWAGTNGMVATVVLQAIAGSASATPWNVTVDAIQVTPDGYDLRTLAGSLAPIRIGAAAGPVLGSIVSPSGGASFGFVITGQAGQMWEIEASTNLKDWTSLLRTNNTTGSVKFTDSKTSQYPVRYYRVVVP